MPLTHTMNSGLRRTNGLSGGWSNLHSGRSWKRRQLTLISCHVLFLLSYFVSPCIFWGYFAINGWFIDFRCRFWVGLCLRMLCLCLMPCFFDSQGNSMNTVCCWQIKPIRYGKMIIYPGLLFRILSSTESDSCSSNGHNLSCHLTGGQSQISDVWLSTVFVRTRPFHLLMAWKKTSAIHQKATSYFWSPLWNIPYRHLMPIQIFRGSCQCFGLLVYAKLMIRNYHCWHNILD